MSLVSQRMTQLPDRHLWSALSPPCSPQSLKIAEWVNGWGYNLESHVQRQGILYVGHLIDLANTYFNVCQGKF